MLETIKVTASVVVYKENALELNKAIYSFVNSSITTKLYIVENYINNFENKIVNHPKIEIIKFSKNYGFGKGHNLVLDKISTESDFHLILNPDVYFDSQILEELVLELKKDTSASMIAPKVFFPNGKFQNSCRKYPKAFELIIRRIPFLKSIFKKTYKNGIYSDKDLHNPFYAEYLTGCFHLYKTEDFIKIKGFDVRYFLYMEDVDICKKIDAFGKKKIYYPNVHIYHVLKQGSLKKLNLLFRHIASAIKYFIKWGF